MKCSRCGAVEEIRNWPKHQWCKSCDAEKRREWYANGGKAIVRKNTKSHRQRNNYPGFSDPLRKHARNLAQAAIRHGRITKKPCESCGEEKSQAHHDDYTKPLDVRFLCGPCHRAEHSAIRALKP